MFLDAFNKEVENGDFVIYTNSNTLSVGVVREHTKQKVRWGNDLYDSIKISGAYSYFPYLGWDQATGKGNYATDPVFVYAKSTCKGSKRVSKISQQELHNIIQDVTVIDMLYRSRDEILNPKPKKEKKVKKVCQIEAKDGTIGVKI